MSSSLNNEPDSYKHSLLPVSSLCKNETYEHGSIPMSSSLKNEIDPSRIESSVLWNLGLEPSFHSPVLLDFLPPFPSGEPIYTSNRESNWVEKISWWMNRSLGGMSPASGYHTWVKPLAFVGHAGRKIPTSGHHVGKKPTDGYIFEHSLFFWFKLI